MNKPHIATYYYIPYGHTDIIEGYGVWRCRDDYLEGKVPIKRAISLEKLKEYWEYKL